MSKKGTTEGFIEKSILKHGKRYDYSKVNYIGTHSKVMIICKIHGEFEQVAKSHFNGSGCSKCVGLKKSNTNDFIEKSILRHGDKYDYSMVKYVTSYNKVIIICKKHGTFEQKPNKHLSGQGCAKCNIINTNFFILKSMEIHSDKYDYSMVDYINNMIKVNIICKKHGIFKQIPNNHLAGSGCSKCKISKGEDKIISILSDNRIEYIYQKTYNDCLSNNGNKLRFDFYLPYYNLCIEYDGEQHFEAITFFGGEKALDTLRKRDDIKNKYCLFNNIELLRIPYYDYDNIEHIIRSKINI